MHMAAQMLLLLRQQPHPHCNPAKRTGGGLEAGCWCWCGVRLRLRLRRARGINVCRPMVSNARCSDSKTPRYHPLGQCAAAMQPHCWRTFIYKMTRKSDAAWVSPRACVTVHYLWPQLCGPPPPTAIPHPTWPTAATQPQVRLCCCCLVASVPALALGAELLALVEAAHVLGAVVWLELLPLLLGEPPKFCAVTWLLPIYMELEPGPHILNGVQVWAVWGPVLQVLNVAGPQELLGGLGGVGWGTINQVHAFACFALAQDALCFGH